MILHGIDMIEIGRIQQAVTRFGERFLARVYTPLELAHYRASPQSLAARWAAKEAAAKLLGVGLRGLGAGSDSQAVRWVEIEILSDPSGRPIIELYGQAAQRAAQLQIVSLAVSLSHTRDLAIASIIGFVQRV
jgi:holo-[acyl-carrier protein] synthase